MFSSSTPHGSRVAAASQELQNYFRDALKQHDQCGYHYYSPELCDAVAHFDRELQRATHRDEIRRRAEIVAEQTGERTPYAEAINRVMEAGLRKYVPMRVMKGCTKCPGRSVLSSELEGVRRLLGPVGDKSLTPPQLTALRDWERELETIEQEAENLCADGCQWLCSLLEYGNRLKNSELLTTERPTAEYEDNLRPTAIHDGFPFGADAIRQMQAAADSLMLWVQEQQGLHGTLAEGQGRGDAGEAENEGKEVQGDAAEDMQNVPAAPGALPEAGRKRPDRKKVDGKYQSEPPPAGSKFDKHGPLVGPLSALAAWAGVDRRILKNQSGTRFWLMRTHGKECQLWFSNQTEYAKANANKLAAGK